MFFGPPFTLGSLKDPQLIALTSLFLIRLVSSLICASRPLISSFVCFTVPSVLTVKVKSLVIRCFCISSHVLSGFSILYSSALRLSEGGFKPLIAKSIYF